MPKKEKIFSRRDFFKITGVAGAGSIVASMGKLASASDKSEPEPFKAATVPTRPFGKTGVNVSMLGLGGSQDLLSKQLLLRQAIKMGVTYWDTAYRYEGGNSEKAIRLFNTIPSTTRKDLASCDYSRAEYLCPQNMPIAKLMNKAVVTLTRS